jgi:2-phosphosulfolactate phosphatase
VIDVLRATSSMLTALQNGALEIHPVSEITEALAKKEQIPSALLAGERHSVRIDDFDLGNSPRDFTAQAIEQRPIIWTTTNGTRALRACTHAQNVFLGALINLQALTDLLDRAQPSQLTLVCAGTFDEPAIEDIYAAGALIDSLKHRRAGLECRDSAQVAWRTFTQIGGDRRTLIESSLNARRLLQKPELAADVAICLEANSLLLNARMDRDGVVRVTS